MRERYLTSLLNKAPLRCGLAWLVVATILSACSTLPVERADTTTCGANPPCTQEIYVDSLGKLYKDAEGGEPWAEDTALIGDPPQRLCFFKTTGGGLLPRVVLDCPGGVCGSQVASKIDLVVVHDAEDNSNDCLRFDYRPPVATETIWKLYYYSDSLPEGPNDGRLKGGSG